MAKINFKISHLYKNGRLFGFGVSPNADWKILFNIFLILILLVSFLGIYMFVGVANGDIFVVDKSPVVEAKNLDTNILQSTISYYESRAAKLEALKTNKNLLVDPSI